MAVGVLVLLLAMLAGCGTGNHDQSLLGRAGAAGPTGAVAASASPRTPADARPTSRAALLRALARAVLDHDRPAYAALLGRGHAGFRARQLRLFDNLQRLPVRGLSFGVDGDEVTRSLRLGSYDARPAVGPAGFRVALLPDRAVVVPDPAHPAADPWDLTSVRVKDDGGALVVTDVADVDRLPDLLESAHTATLDDDDVVHLPWSHTVVVYAFREAAVLASYAQVPGGNPDHLGALTYPVLGASGAQVGSRIAVLPGALDADPGELDWILRHEITHVAVGAEADDVPTWLSEGIAEYVAAQATPRRQRRIATIAVSAARLGGIEIPADFGTGDQSLHYAESWQACEYLAATRGPAVLWALLDALHQAHVGRDGRDGVGQDAVLRQVAGLTSAQLTSRTGARIRRLFARPPAAGVS